mmetsp:Transcript_55099/g.102021  ORF Transcript_55099/g.102021 Transcript_55099/m.102021 type:complete len:184 (+) Transcript_55099:102-653(+)
MSTSQVWEVVGGADKGGIIVRAGKDNTSDALNRISTGALLRELQIDGDKMQYERLTGTGPMTGWVTLKLKDKDLCTKSSKAILRLKFMSPVEQDEDGNNLHYCDLHALPETTVGQLKALCASKTGLKPGCMIPAKGKMGERITEGATIKEDLTLSEAGYAEGDEFAFIYTGTLETDLKPPPTS